MNDNPTPEEQVEVPTQVALEKELPQPPDDSPKWVLRGLLAFLAVLLTFIGYVGRLLGWWCLALLLCASANAVVTTYYVGNDGSDSHDGKSKANDFAHWPQGRLFTGTYVRAAGDQFIARGNDAWNNAEFPLVITNGGTASIGNAYFGVDKTWFSGSSWGMPVLNAGGSLIANYSFYGDGMIFADADSWPSNVVIDSFELTGFYFDSTANSGSGYILGGNVTNWSIINCLFTNVTHATADSGCLDTFACITGSTSLLNPGCYQSNNIFDLRPSGTDCGDAVYCWPVNSNSIAANMRTGYLPNGNPCIVSGCTISNLNASFAGAHGAAIEPQGQIGIQYIHNNIVHDNNEVTIMIGGAGINGAAYIYDNIIYNTTVGVLLSWFSGAANQASIWNNVIDVSKSPVYAILSELGSWTVAAQNNLVAGETSFSLTGSLTVDHNVFGLPSGFNSGNLYYNPANSAAVFPGTSAPSSTFTTDFNGATFNPWYIGPYAYGSSPVAQAVIISGGGQILVTAGGQINVSQ